MRKKINLNKRVVYVSDSLLRYGKQSQLLKHGYRCDCGQSQALETRSTIWVRCESCKRGYPDGE